MSSSVSPTPYPIPATVLTAGNYYLVDVVDILSVYFKIGAEYRRPDALMPVDFTDLDALEVELNALMPCLESFSAAEDCLRDHCRNVRETAFDLEPLVIDDTEGKGFTVISKLGEEIILPYESSLYHLGLDIRDRLKEGNYYNARGGLVGDFQCVAGEGLLIIG